MGIGNFLIGLGAVIWIAASLGARLGSVNFVLLGAGLIALGFAFGGIAWPWPVRRSNP